MVTRFWAKVDVGSEGSCWVWTGAVDSRGYGRLAIDCSARPIKYMSAHRFSHTLWFGPIPEGMLICHRCDNPPCCNPAHLFPGTQADNMRDMAQKGRGGTGGVAGSRHHNARLTEADVIQIRERLSTHESVTSVADAWSVSRQTVSAIKHGTRWGHLS